MGLTLFVGDSLWSCGTRLSPRMGCSLCSLGCSFHSLFAESANFGKGKFGGGKRFFGGLALEMGLSKYE